ncbi:MAG: hypothetical protein RLZZ455_356 [Candidatus Parcubacteria bacterium]|jgi:hypothetical protein
MFTLNTIITFSAFLYLSLTIATSSHHLVEHLPHIILASVLSCALALITTNHTFQPGSNTRGSSLRLRALILLVATTFFLAHTTPIHMMNNHDLSSHTALEHPCCMPALTVATTEIFQSIYYLQPSQKSIQELPLQSEKPVIFTNKPPPTS